MIAQSLRPGVCCGKSDCTKLSTYSSLQTRRSRYDTIIVGYVACGPPDQPGARHGPAASCPCWPGPRHKGVPGSAP